MLRYSFQLALRGLKRNLALTVLTVAAVGVGIGTCMTVLTTLVGMSGNPIPDKSSQLFVPQIDVAGPAARRSSGGPDGAKLPSQLTYRDAVALLKAHRGVRQTAMYEVAQTVNPPGGRPFQVAGRATYADFFTMFEAPFRAGAAWGQQQDDNRENVVVLGAHLAERVFPHRNPVGSTINLNSRDYRIIGVLDTWLLIPHFYDLTGGGFADTEDFYIPFTTAIERQIPTWGGTNCTELPPPGWQGRLNSSCVWIQFWVELPSAAQVRAFRDFLQGYAAQQQQLGRFHWPAEVALHDVTDWLVYSDVVPHEVRVNSLVAIGLLVVCLVNAVGLMLAKFSGRSVELSLRRALGASRRDVYLQCIVETTIVGFLGGLLGLALTAAGLAVLRALLDLGGRDSVSGRLAYLDTQMVVITVIVAIVATMCSGLYPTYRASRIQPAWQLKVQ
ncbi:MAG TPA: ABC transporter permease [Steroidobacteraceae bacterium]|jgi:putative ABC transport system permease protein|nr:ABC transporter permease [Steroidobacteraceae bacterium]